MRVPIRSCAAMVILMIALGIPARAAIPPEGGAAQSTRPRAPRIYAYYYLWWSERHWHDKLGPEYPYGASELPLPARLGHDGCNAESRFDENQLTDVPWQLFDQDEPGTIARDVRVAAAAGLRGFLVNWRGSGETDQTSDSISYSRRLEELVRAVERQQRHGTRFKLWLNYKASSEHLDDRHIVNDLAYFVRTYGDSPAFGRRGDGRIVTVWGGSRKYPVDTIRTVSTIIRDDLFLVGDENWKTWGDGRARYLDGDQYYWSSQNPYSNPSSFEQLEELAEMVRGSEANPDGSRKAWFAPVTPGYNSELLRGGSCVPRKGTETLRRLWDGNRRSDPDAWVLISWNEIAEGTYVRPMQRWGRMHLRQIEELAGR